MPRLSPDDTEMTGMPSDAPPCGRATACKPAQLQYPPYREPSFELATQTGLKIAQMIAETLEKSSQSPPKTLLKEAKELANYRLSTERLVGFLGHSGHGKSSTINSVLGNEDLAKTEACGSAVTPFAVEYRFPKPEHKSPFTMECNMMTMSEIGEYLGNLLRDFRRVEFADEQERISNFEDLQADSRAAQDVFEAAFDGMTDFDISLLEHKDNEESRKAAIETLKSYAVRLDFPDDMDDKGFWIQEAKNAEECQQQQSILQERGLWPFVKQLTVYANIDILNPGLTLVDLPGSQDTNLARVRAARKAQAKCESLCIVTNIGRAVDNPVIQQTLEGLRGATDGLESPSCDITLVCTHSGDLSNRRPIEKLVSEAELRKAKAELHRVTGSRGDFKSSEAYTRACKSAEFKIDTLLIQSRNAKVRTGLLRKYRNLFGEQDVKVFCIDNMLETQAGEDIDGALNGIPQLRQHLRDLPAEAFFKEKDFFISNKIPALVASFQNWVESNQSISPGSIEQSPSLPDTDSLELSYIPAAWIPNTRMVFNQKIKNIILSSSPTITSQCLEAARHWESWKSASVLSWVRRHGNHITQARGSVNWNWDLLYPFVQAVGKRWTELKHDVVPSLADLKASILGVWEVYELKCRQLNAPPNLQASLTGRINNIRNDLDSAEHVWHKGLKHIKTSSTTPNWQGGSYIVDCMLETYEEGRTFSGRGSTALRHQALQQRVSHSDFVDDFVDRISKDFEDLMAKVSTKITKVLETELQAVRSDIEVMQKKKMKETEPTDFKTNQTMIQAELTKIKDEIDYEELSADIQKMICQMDELAATAREMAKIQPELWSSNNNNNNNNNATFLSVNKINGWCGRMTLLCWICSLGDGHSWVQNRPLRN
ncbi:hypothetical protein ABEF93_007530 [Exophiala dermatitidis]